MRKSYKAKIQKLTGYSNAEYESRYAKIAAQTRNYNAVAGTTYKAAHVFYLSIRYAGELSDGIQNILATPATRARLKGQAVTNAIGKDSKSKVTSASSTALLKRWSKFIEQSRKDKEKGFGRGAAAQIADDLKAGKITSKQANNLFKDLIKERDERRDTDPAYKY